MKYEVDITLNPFRAEEGLSTRLSKYGDDWKNLVNHDISDCDQFISDLYNTGALTIIVSDAVLGRLTAAITGATQFFALGNIRIVRVKWEFE